MQIKDLERESESETRPIDRNFVNLKKKVRDQINWKKNWIKIIQSRFVGELFFQLV